MILHQSKNSFWKNKDLNVKIGKTDIKKTNNYKYLEINIDRNLNWSEQIETIKTKLQKTCINDINVLINRAIRCRHYMKYDDSVKKLKTEKKN